MRRMHIQNVEPGMVLGKALYGDNYEVLLNKGVVLVEGYINRLKSRGFIKVILMMRIPLMSSLKIQYLIKSALWLRKTFLKHTN